MKSWIGKEFKNKVAILSGARTPFAKAGANLKKTSAVHLGVTALKEALARAEASPSLLDEVVLGNAGTPADAANISRVIALRAQVPEATPAYTVHRNCASALEAIAQGCLKISTGICDVMAVGGTESMSQMPLMYGPEMTEFFAQLAAAKSSTQKLQVLTHFHLRFLKPKIALLQGLTDPISGLNMGETAEILARDFHITREAQDAFAVESHRRAVAAEKEHFFQEERCAVMLEPDFSTPLETDIGPREGQSLEQLARLRPFFDKSNGTITAGNACPVTDGAAVLVLMNAERAKAEGRPILGTIEGYCFTGCEPKRMGMGPVYSTHSLLRDLQMPLKEIGLVELNEAFSSQVMANQKAFESKEYAKTHLGSDQPLGELSSDKLNIHGGAVALGHPVGATGARLVLTNLFALRRRKQQFGLSTLCIGGGQGGAMVIQNVA